MKLKRQDTIYSPEGGAHIDPARLKVGTILQRWYNGRRFVVEIIEPLGGTETARKRGWWRYRYAGRRWKTLSAIARSITGFYYESGPRFFGLTSRKRT